jgi:Ni/Co efflux regulator RcnB
MEPSMNSKALVSAIMAMSLTTGGFAFAQGQGDRNERGRNEQAQRGGEQDRRGNEARQRDRREDRGRANERRDERGAGPNHAFHRGDRLPAEYRHRHYVVDDWRGHNLSAPPRGYHWVQTGGDYVLVAIATGVILQLLLSN